MQHRDPPAYQEYAASILAKSSFRELTLQEKGLLYTLKLECWVNKSLPKCSKKLAIYAGATEQEISDILPKIMQFFAEKNSRISSPELDNYRAHLEKISEARRNGAKATNSIKSSKKHIAQALNERSQDNRSSVESANAESTLPSLVKLSSVKSSLNTTSMSDNLSHGHNDYTFDPDSEVEL